MDFTFLILNFKKGHEFNEFLINIENIIIHKNINCKIHVLSFNQIKKNLNTITRDKFIKIIPLKKIDLLNNINLENKIIEIKPNFIIGYDFYLNSIIIQKKTFTFNL